MRITPLFLLVLFVYHSFSQILVIQQGRDGYSGCKDSFIMHSDYGPMKTLNFGDADTIYTDVCYT